MAFYDSSISVFQVTDTGAVLRDISAYITQIGGVPGVRELTDVTSLVDTGKKWNPSIEDVTITLELLWSEDASVGPDTVLGPLRTDTTARAWDYGPEGKVTGDIKYSGTCFVRSYEVVSRVGSHVVARAELKVNGVVTRGTYA